MSLFIGELAFANAAMLDAAKIGTLLGSALATAAGYLLLRVMKPGVVSETDSDEAEEIFAENIADEPEVDGLR